MTVLEIAFMVLGFLWIEFGVFKAEMRNRKQQEKEENEIRAIMKRDEDRRKKERGF